MSEDPPPALNRLVGSFGCALTIDVEEWYHTCMVREYVEPERRPALENELDRLLPELLDLLAGAGAKATFFVLGEVAKRLPDRVRQIAAAGHEVGSHSYLHLRSDWLGLDAWRRDVAASKSLLEDLTGCAVLGFRAPEWSLRRVGNPRLLELERLGFLYDSSLAPCVASGSTRNPLWSSRLAWRGGEELYEFPPLTWAGRLQLPASGWTARLLPGRVIAATAREHQRRGGLPVLVAHPWELSGRPTPGVLTGLARFVHEAGRGGYRGRFVELLEMLPCRSIVASAGVLLDNLTANRRRGLPPTLELPRRPIAR